MWQCPQGSATQLQHQLQEHHRRARPVAAVAVAEKNVQLGERHFFSCMFSHAASGYSHRGTECCSGGMIWSCLVQEATRASVSYIIGGIQPSSARCVHISERAAGSARRKKSGDFPHFPHFLDEISGIYSDLQPIPAKFLDIHIKKSLK